MAKKTTPSSSASTPRTRRTTKPPTVAASPDNGSGSTSADGHQPTADEIAQEAYQRYLSRGGQHGSDFDDWIAAERALIIKRSR